MTGRAEWGLATWLTMLVIVSGESLQCDFCQCRPLKTNENSFTGMELNCSSTRSDFVPSGKQVLIPNYNYGDHQVTYVWAYFRRNNITQVQILNLGLVSKLYLDENDISVLYDNAFSNFGRTLEELSLSHNKLQEVRLKVFEQLKVLEVLDLSYNLLVELNFDDFNLKDSLKTLILSGNQIINITNSGSRKLSSLETLDLSFNQLISINKNYFLNLTRLNTLNLSNNKLSTLQRSSFVPLTALQSLDLSHNSLSTFSMPPLKSLRRLNIGYNTVSNLQTVLKVFPSLEELQVQVNGIQILNSSAELGSLQVLNLSGNALTDFVSQNFPDMTDLDLSYNKLTEVPTTLNGKSLPYLTSLSLDGNPLAAVEFSTVGSPFTKLQRLSVCHLEDLQALTEKSFSWLTQPDQGYAGLHLAASHNPRLADIHKKAFEYVKLVELDLSYNALTSLPMELVRWEEVPTVDLQGNPWDCQCSLQWMVDEVVGYTYEKGDRRYLVDLRCESPAALRDRRFVHFYGWKTPAFCGGEDVFGRLKSGDDMQVNVSAGSSEGMLIAVSVLGALFLVLVIAGLVVHHRNKTQRRNKNRRW